MAGLESARIMREDWANYTGVNIGDTVIIEYPKYLKTNNLKEGTRGVVERIGGHGDFYKEPHFTIKLVGEERSFVVFPHNVRVVDTPPGGILHNFKPAMRWLMEGQIVALLKDLALPGPAGMVGNHGIVAKDTPGTVLKVASDGLAEVNFSQIGTVICAPDMLYLIEDAPPAKAALKVIEDAGDNVLVKHGKMTRSKKAVHMEYVPASLLEAVGRRLAVGIERGHKRDNWREGVGSEEAREATINHLLHHIFDYLENGNTTESNTDAIACNAAFLVEYEKHTPYKGVNQRRKNG